MKKVAYSLVVAASLASSSVFAADMAVKAPPAPAPAPNPWDLVVTAALMSDYNFRGVTQSNHRPSTQAGFELRYNFTSSLQGYGGISGESIDFPNRAAAEIDFYAGIRPTLDKLALDFGFWEYYYPDGQCFGSVSACSSLGGGPSVVPFFGTLPNGNVVKQNESFWEVYGKGTYTVNDNFNFGGSIWYSPSVVNTGAWGVYYAGNVTLTAPTTWFSNGIGAYASGDVGYWNLGTSDLFYAAPPAFPTGVPYTSYTNWDAGIGFTWKVLTLDLRYYDSNLTKAECNVFTSDHTATGFVGSPDTTPQNPGGLGSNWCSATFIAKLSASFDFASNLK